VVGAGRLPLFLDFEGPAQLAPARAADLTDRQAALIGWITPLQLDETAQEIQRDLQARGAGDRARPVAFQQTVRVHLEPGAAQQPGRDLATAFRQWGPNNLDDRLHGFGETRNVRSQPGPDAQTVRWRHGRGDPGFGRANVHIRHKLHLDEVIGDRQPFADALEQGAY